MKDGCKLAKFKLIAPRKCFNMPYPIKQMTKLLEILKNFLNKEDKN